MTYYGVSMGSYVGGISQYPPQLSGGMIHCSNGGDPRGGTAPEHSAFDIQLIRSSHAPTPIPSPQPDTNSSLATLVVSVLEDSTSDPRVKASPILVIKDKLSDLGLKEIMDNELWIEAKKIIDACLRRPPYCPSLTSKALLATPENQVTSSWWEKVLYYYVKFPILDLFVKNFKFNCNGFEMIVLINQYFHPSGTVNSLGCIFQLIDIKQDVDKPVIMLKAQFSCLVTHSKWGV
jgi:hypothetical protein